MRARRYYVGRSNNICESITRTCLSDKRYQACRKIAWPYFSATLRQLSPSPPTTRMQWFFMASMPFLPWANSANGVWLWTNKLVSSGTFSRSDSSATRSFSCVPPPFVRRINGIRSRWRKARDWWALGRALELRRSTPSMLSISQSPSIMQKLFYATHSNAKAKSECLFVGTDVLRVRLCCNGVVQRTHCLRHPARRQCKKDVALLVRIELAAIGMLREAHKIYQHGVRADN